MRIYIGIHELKIDELPEQMVVTVECRQLPLLVFHISCLLCPEYLPFSLW